MTTLFAFLRAINVGGHTVKMATLRGLFEELGLKDMETFIASGNVIFTSNAKDIRALERKIERRLEESLGFEVATFLRTAPELVAIANRQPFSKTRIESAGAFCTGFLTDPLDARAGKALAALKTDIDDFHLAGREVYWLCAKKQHESKFSNVAFEKATGARVTFRGAATVAKLAAKTG